MPTDAGTILLTLARSAIARALDMPASGQAIECERHDWLQSPGASFVTLTQRGQLRGCIGSLEAHRALFRDVQANAVAAALRDPRFPPLAGHELHCTAVEVSLLSATEPMAFDSEADALGQLRPGVDGLLLEYGQHRSTFLPQVWEQLPHARDFMSQLKRKAGLPAGFWHEAIRLQRYTVSKFKEAA